MVKFTQMINQFGCCSRCPEALEYSDCTDDNPHRMCEWCRNSLRFHERYEIEAQVARWMFMSGDPSTFEECVAMGEYVASMETH